MSRLVAGFIAGALWMPAFAYFADREYGMVMTVMIAIFTVPLTLFVAAPLYYLFRNKIGLWTCMAFGVVIGLIGAGIFGATTHYEAFVRWAPLLVGAGWLSSMIFWFVGIWRNPNLTLNSTRTPSGAGQRSRYDPLSIR